jgi:hypothetical protein
MSTAVGHNIGLDANRPIDPRTGAIEPQVADPRIHAATGAHWVRLNFVLGPWSGTTATLDRLARELTQSRSELDGLAREAAAIRSELARTRRRNLVVAIRIVALVARARPACWPFC